MQPSIRTALAAWTLFAAARAHAQASFDPPTAIRPPPNVMLLMDATRTNGIAATACGTASCHAEASCGDCTILGRGETRIQLAKRALTGGYGWSTAALDPGGLPADAAVRTDGVMDAYKVRWGVAWYDGLGTRLAIDPTTDPLAAQRAVIDFGQAPNDAFGPAGDPGLNSFFLFPRTTQCCGNSHRTDGVYDYTTPTQLPWWPESAHSEQRMARALKWMENYWRTGKDAKKFNPGPAASPFPMWFSPGPDPTDETVVDADVSNVLVSSGAAGCRRNFTVLLSDGGGQTDYADDEGDDDDASGGKSIGKAAARIYGLGGLAADKANQVFSIHFGTWAPADAVADYGWDGVAGGGGLTSAYNAAPGGVLSIPPMLAAFGAIFSLVLAGDYNGAPPTLTRFGDHLVKSAFKIRSCAGLSPNECNLGRPATLQWVPVSGGALGAPDWDAGAILRARSSTNRSLYTAYWPGHPAGISDAGCGPAAGPSCSRTVAMAPLNTLSLAGIPGVSAMDINFIRGNPTATFANFALLGDSNGDLMIDDPYKLSDILGSRPLVVGAPPGIGEDLARWDAFRNSRLSRSVATGGDGSTSTGTAPPLPLTVSTRDQVIYVGGNDGYLHAFLTGKVKSTPDPGASASYVPMATTCAAALPPTGELGPSAAVCNGKELWAYSPAMLQPRWPALRGGHYFMVDGTPVVEDVLFTKNKSTAGAVCSYTGAGPDPVCSDGDWEYRTVLVECLSGGGPGCFALDVTNPWRPELLWERSFSCPGPACVVGKGTGSSQPTIVRAKRVVGGKPIPYYVALMGGGQNESLAGAPKGTFIAIGVEDGQVYSTPVPAAVDLAAGPACIDADNDSYTDTCYLPGSDGSLWKARLAGGLPGSMSVVKFFDGRLATGSSTIRAFTKAVVTPTADNKLAIFYATGNLEDASGAAETNYMFKLIDSTPKTMPAWSGALNLSRQSGACSAGADPLLELTAVGGQPGSFRMAAGEKVMFDPVLASGTVMFTSYRPDANPCLVGNGYLYGLRHDSCAAGVDTDGDPAGTPDDGKVSLLTGVPSGVAVAYAKGEIFVANSDSTMIPTSAKPPPPAQNRFYKLRWRIGL